jgi:hypothetical protein
MTENMSAAQMTTRRLAFRPTSRTWRDRKTQRVMVAFYFILFS